MTLINTNEHHPEMTTAVYFGTDGEFLIIPLAKDNEGWRSQVNRPVRLAWDGVSAPVLGEAVLECLSVSAVSIGHDRDPVPPFLLASGAKSYREFAKTHQLVDVASMENGDHIEVQFWPRNANLMYVGPPDERPDWTVVLPLGASAVQIGGAIIQVLQAGGVSLAAGSDTTGGLLAGDGIGYCQFRAGLLSDFQILEGEADDLVEAVTRLLDSVGQTVNDEPPLFVCAVITCALICLEKGFLPDYLDEPARSLGDISSRLSGDDLRAYQSDVALLASRLAAGPRIVESPCPPDYFPGTWGPAAEEASRARWNNLLQGR